MSEAAEGDSRQDGRGDRMGRRQMSLMQVFRTAHRNRDARDPGRVGGNDTDLTRRSQQRREGGSEAALRNDLAQDIASLMNTIRLDSLFDLSDVPYVQRSVINYGFQDLSSITKNYRVTGLLCDAIRETLVAHEPRLIPSSVEVKLPDQQDEDDHRLQFDISAEMYGTPADIPLDFVAEVDLGAGKVHMQRLRVSE